MCMPSLVGGYRMEPYSTSKPSPTSCTTALGFIWASKFGLRGLGQGERGGGKGGTTLRYRTSTRPAALRKITTFQVESISALGIFYRHP